MIKYVSGCVACGFPCRKSHCPYYMIPEFYCDKCNEEVDDLFELEDKELCFDCLKEETKIEIS